MPVKVSMPEPKEFDRSPYIFEKTRINEFGNEITEQFYSVAGRKLEFLFLYPDGRYPTEVVNLRPDFAVFRCEVYLSASDEKPFRTAHASRELDSTSEIGRRFIECAETAAIGRALANAGIGADALLDEMDGLERTETGGTPIGRKESQTPPAQKNVAARKDADPPQEAPKTAKAEPEVSNTNEPVKQMSDEEALSVVITTTNSKTLKGKTFADATALVKDMEKFQAFLEGMTKNGTEPEKMAAELLLPKLIPAKAS